MRMCIAAALVTAGMLMITGTAAAKVPASPSQKAAIAHDLPGHLPARCSRDFISTINRSWASTTFHDAPGCLRFASDGIAILHLEHGRWHGVTAGSDFRCPIQSYRGQPTVPASVAEDLIGIDCASKNPSILCAPVRIPVGDHMIDELEITHRGVSCSEADKIDRAFGTRHKTVIHRGAGLNSTYWTLRAFPGWRCEVGAGGGSCSDGKGLAAYTVTPV
jgi:hypothetical protein